MRSEIRNNLLLLVLLGFIITSGKISAQENSTHKSVFPPVTIHRAETHIMKSQINSQTYPIDIALPGSYYTSNKSYPVVYMLDAYSSFGIVVQLQRLLAFDNELPEMIIVGVSSEGGSREFIYNRSRDYTPTKIDVEKLPAAYKSSIPVSGGAEKFLGFIKNELIPYIDSKYRTIPDDRTLTGHSLGGLFVFYSLFQEPELFKRYVAVSPALSWDGEYVLKQEIDFFENGKSADAIVYTSIGSLESDDFKSSWKNLVSDLQGRKTAIKLNSEIVENETHYTMIPLTVTHGLKSVFREWTK